MTPIEQPPLFFHSYHSPASMIQNSNRNGPTIFACLSNALTLANSFLLLLSAIKIWVWFFTEVCRTERGPLEISASSRRRICSSVSSDLGVLANCVTLLGSTKETSVVQSCCNNHSLAKILSQVVPHLALRKAILPSKIVNIEKQNLQRSQENHSRFRSPQLARFCHGDQIISVAFHHKKNTLHYSTLASSFLS